MVGVLVESIFVFLHTSSKWSHKTIMWR